MQTLSRREENEVVDIARKQAHKLCDDVVREFAECSAGRTVTMPFACRPQINAMNNCLKQHMTEDRLDALRLEYISERSEHGRAAVEALQSGRVEYLRKAYGDKGKAGASGVVGAAGVTGPGSGVQGVESATR